MDYIRQSVNRSVKTFTILRHPIERCLSYRDWWMDRSPEWTRFLRNKSVAEFFEAPGYQRRGFYCFNGMVRQLGRGLNETFASYPTMSPQERTSLLEAAKKRLKELDLVGFYENMNWDFFRLRREIFPETEVHWSYRILYQLGTWFGLSRLKILKYTASAKPSDLEYLHSILDLDLELWEWARVEFADQSNPRLYNDFAEFFLGNLPYWVPLTARSTSSSSKANFSVLCFCCGF